MDDDQSHDATPEPLTRSTTRIREWILPTVTTFIGVFAAAWLTIWSEDAREEEEIRMLLDVAYTDACSSLGSVKKVNGQLAAGKSLGDVVPISYPRIMQSVLEDNATTFAEFYEPITRELVGHLSMIEHDISEFKQLLEEAQTMQRISSLLREDDSDQENDKNRDDSSMILQQETARLVSKAKSSAIKIEESLSRLALLIRLQSGLKWNKLTTPDVDDRLKESSPSKVCT